jgi:hypothetical protein
VLVGVHDIGRQLAGGDLTEHAVSHGGSLPRGDGRHVNTRCHPPPDRHVRYKDTTRTSSLFVPAQFF